MQKNIEPELKKIGEYLKLDVDVEFVIPEYQRPYSWESNNCDKLWQDIKAFQENGTKGSDDYFFGTVIINCDENNNNYALIDGQQRTITFLLLLKALLININNAILNTSQDEDAAQLLRGLKARRKDILKILYRAEDEDIFDVPNTVEDKKLYEKSVILSNVSINEKYASDFASILQSSDFIEAEKNVIKIKYKQKDNKYTNYFKNFKFFNNKISELNESMINSFTKTLLESCQVIQIKSWKVEQAITMFNSLNSDGMPLCDSDIISAKLYAKAKGIGKEKDFSDKWQELLDLIEELESKNVLNIDSLLMQYMYYKRAKDNEIVSEKTNAVNVTTPGLRRYFTDLKKEILDDPINLCDSLMDLAKIWIKAIKLPIVKVLLEFNENSKLFLGGYFYRFKPETVQDNDIICISESFLKLFTIMELVDVGYSSKYFKTFLFKESVKLVDASIPASDIVSEFKTHISNNWKQNDIEDKIKEYDKHCLVFINEYLFAKENTLSFDFNSTYDIEHIMPNSGNNIQQIRVDAGIVDTQEFESIVNKVGNKILLEQKINRSIGNEWFSTKVSNTLESKQGYINSKCGLAIKLVEYYSNQNHPLWKKNNIIDATEKAAKRISNYIFN